MSADAALVGSNGLQAVIDDNNAIFLTDDLADQEAQYRARFYFDPNSIGMASGDSHYIFWGYNPSSGDVFRMNFRYWAGNYQLQAFTYLDGGSVRATPWQTLSDEAHFVELDWQAGSGVGADDGQMTLWIDGVEQASLSGLDNDTQRGEFVRLGAIAGVDNGTRGTYYFDAFASQRQSYIGP